MILGFRREVDENGAPLGYNAASSGNSLPTFRETYVFIFKGQESLDHWPLQMGQLVCLGNVCMELPLSLSLRHSPKERSSKIMSQ